MPIADLGDVKLNYIHTEPSSERYTQDLILIHGLAANLGFWYLQMVPAFSSKFRVTIFDLRGHGRSSMPNEHYTAADMAEDLKGLMDHLNIRRAHIIGHSFGGAIALQFACSYSERLYSVVLADVLVRSLRPKTVGSESAVSVRKSLKEPGLEFDGDGFEFGFRFFEQSAEARINQTYQPIARQLLPHMPFSEGKGGLRLANLWLKLLNTTSARQDFLKGDQLLLEQLAGLRIPTLLVYGEKSQVLPTLHALKNIWSHAYFEIIPDAGHFFPMSKPKQLIDSVGFFLDQSQR